MPYFAGPVADERDTLLTFLGVPLVVAGVAGQPLPGLQETARHAGHADIIREALGGRLAGQLLDACEAG